MVSRCGKIGDPQIDNQRTGQVESVWLWQKVLFPRKACQLPDADEIKTCGGVLRKVAVAGKHQSAIFEESFHKS